MQKTRQSPLLLLTTHTILLLASIVLSSCVSAGKYDEMEAAKNNQQERADSLQTMLQQMTKTLVQLDANVSERSADSAQLHEIITKQALQIDSLARMLGDLTDRFTALAGNYNQLKATNAKETQKLLNSLEKVQQEVIEKQGQQRETSSQLKTKDSVLARLQKDLAAREQRLKDVEQKLQARDAALRSLRSKIAEALAGVKEGDLTVEMKNGRVYVSLSNRLLFASGSTEIEKGGKAALKQLSAALNKQSDINIIVEGHTDDAKVSNLGAIKDNWDLSVMRSTEVIRFLTQDGKLDAKRITASGRGEYAPVEAGSTPEIRAKNRRTDIVLTPKLDELFDILQRGK